MGFVDKYPYSNFHEINLDWLIETVKKVKEETDGLDLDVEEFKAKVIEEIQNMDIAAIVDQWMEDHPEVTTTVQDGSLTIEKFAAQLVKETLNRYVTPQDYGAVADGETDDSIAIQAALDSGYWVFFPRGTYAVGTDLSLDNKNDWVLDASGAIFKYTGTGSCFQCRTIRNSVLRFNEIEASSGNCIRFFGAVNHVDAGGQTVRDWTQYVELYFNRLKASASVGACVEIYNEDDNWVNEVHVFGGRMETGKYGFRFIHSSNHGISGWKFYNVGAEGVDVGWYFQGDGTHGFEDMAFWSCRIREQYAAGAKAIQNVSCPLISFLWVAADDYTSDAYYNQLFALTNCRNVMLQTPVKWLIWNGSTYVKRTLTALNSLTDGVQIPANADLNTEPYYAPGSYYVATTADARTLQNSPIQYAFRMTVESSSGPINLSGNYTYLIRKIVANAYDRIYYQRVEKSGGVWSPKNWFYITGTTV